MSPTRTALACLVLVLIAFGGSAAPAPVPRPVPPPVPITLFDVPGAWSFTWGGAPGTLWLHFPDGDKGGTLEEVWSGQRYWGRWVLLPAVKGRNNSDPVEAAPYLVIEDYDVNGNRWRWESKLRRGKRGEAQLLGEEWQLKKP